MRASVTMAGTTLPGWPTLMLPALLLMASAVRAQVAVLTVGDTIADPTCDYINTRYALVAAAALSGGTVEIRVAYAQDTTLAYSWRGTHHPVVVADPRSNIRVVGGYASCSAPLPTPGQHTRLTYGSDPDSDADYTLLAISNSTGTRRYVDLVHIDMAGAFDADKGGPMTGGGLKLGGNIEVTLTDSRVTGFNSTYQGGGIALLGTGTDPTRYPRVNIYSGSYVSLNTSGFGGGIGSDLGRVVMAGGTVAGNRARQWGGGINISDRADAGDASDDSHFALVLDNSGGPNTITNNTAGTRGTPGNGFGGGVHSYHGQILFKPHRGGPGFQSFVSANYADYGGGIYISGPAGASGGPYTAVRLHDTRFQQNIAARQGGALSMANAVDAWVAGRGGPCSFVSYGLMRQGPCSVFDGNTVEGREGGDTPRGGAIFLHNLRSDGASRAIVRVLATWFLHNVDINGLAAVAAADGTSEMVFNRSIFTENHARTVGNGASALIWSHTGKNVDFRYNTVLDSNTSTRMFNMDGGNLDVTGSILWGTVDRGHPFHFVWFATSGTTFTHNGCLLVRASDDGTAGLPSPGQLWAGYEPQLDARFAPRGSSPAIDHCDSPGYSPPNDAYGHGVYDVPGVAARWSLFPPYNFDLGAVEQTDIIFANSFGHRPGN